MNEYKFKEVNVRLRLEEGSALYSTSPMTSPSAATNVMKDVLKEMDREMVCVVNLDHKLRPINYNIVSIGSMDSSLVPIQNVYKSCILSNAFAIMLFHNHPSGDITPSKRDISITRKLIEVGKLMEIPLVDHLIIGGGNGDTFSFKENYPKLFQNKIDMDLIHTLQVNETNQRYGGETNTMMSFEQFIDWSKKNVREYLPKDLQKEDIIIKPVNKLGEKYTGMTLLTSPDGINISSTVNLNEFYQHYLDGYDDYPLLSRMSDILEKQNPYKSMSWISDYSQVKEHLFVRISNTKANAELLEHIPHKDYIDLSLTYHIHVKQEKDGTYASAMINNDLFERYNVSLEQLHADALENSNKLFQPRLSYMRNHLDKNGFTGISELPLNGQPELLILTNDVQINGAAVLFYPGVMKELSERINGDYYILPSSIHEVLLIQDSEKVDYHKLEQTVKDVNRNMVDPKEKLSDCVYHYDAKEKVFELASAYAHKEKDAERASVMKQLNVSRSNHQSSSKKENKSHDQVL